MTKVKHGVVAIDQEEIQGALKQFRPIHLEKVDRATLQKWKELVDANHYLGYKQPFGAQLR